VNRSAGSVLIAAGVLVIALGALGAASEGDEAQIAGTTDGATGGPTGSQTGGGTTGLQTGVTGPTTGATGVTTPVLETPQEFLPAFSEAFRQGDDRSLFARLHPVVIGFYGSRACRTFTRGLIDPNADFVFLSTSEPQRYRWEVDGVTTPVEDVLTVRVTVVSADGETERDIHLGIVDTELRWFADCGDPA